MRIYISGPYSAPTEEGRLANTERAMWAGIKLIQMGHTPYIPHLYHYVDTLATKNNVHISYEQWMEQDLMWLAMSEALLYLESSPGANTELEFAKSIGMPIFYNIEEIQ